jgi:hypothetical protein
MKLRCEDVQGRNVLTNFWVRCQAQSAISNHCHSGPVSCQRPLLVRLP